MEQAEWEEERADMRKELQRARGRAERAEEARTEAEAACSDLRMRVEEVEAEASSYVRRLEEVREELLEAQAEAEGLKLDNIFSFFISKFGNLIVPFE